MGIDAIEEFRKSHGINTKGNLAGILQLNRAFSKDTLPINPDDYLTGKEGQVKGLSGANCQSILEEYHIKRVLASEGGRTSRGLMGIMKDYATLINEERPSSKDFSEIERFWIDRIRKFFNSKPFRLEADESLSITAAVGNLLEQAKKRQKENPGTMYEGTVLQQLVAAKLSIIMPEVEINGASVADDPTGRGGDFNIGDTAIHCTTAPATLLMEKCQRNIKNGFHPIIITVKDRVKPLGIWQRIWASLNDWKSGIFNRSCQPMSMSMVISAKMHAKQCSLIWSPLTTRLLTHTRQIPACVLSTVIKKVLILAANLN